MSPKHLAFASLALAVSLLGQQAAAQSLDAIKRVVAMTFVHQSGGHGALPRLPLGHGLGGRVPSPAAGRASI